MKNFDEIPVPKGVQEAIDETVEMMDYVHNIAYNKAIEDVKELAKKFYGGLMLERACQELDALKQKI